MIYLKSQTKPDMGKKMENIIVWICAMLYVITDFMIEHETATIIAASVITSIITSSILSAKC